jgi:lipoprotein-releasing system permease protein
MAYEAFIARRFLRSRRHRVSLSLITFLALTGVAVGVTVLVTVTAVMSGAQAGFRERVLGVSAHLLVMRYGEALGEHGTVLERLDAVPGVVAAAPFVYAHGLLRSAKGTAGTVLRGVDPALEGRVTGVLPPELLAGLQRDAQTRGDAPGPPGIVLGRELARQLEVTPGDQVFMLSAQGGASAVTQVPGMRRLRVLGTIDTGLYDFDKSLGYMHLADVQRIMGLGEAVSGIGVRVENAYRAPQVREQIVDVLGFPYWAKDWTQLYQNMFGALRLQKTVMFVILILIVLVAAFNVAGTLFMMVNEKTRDIAILKAMGATDGSIGQIFVLKGMLIGLAGILMGLAGGFGLCALLRRYRFVELDPKIYPFTRLPVDVQAADVALIVACALLICFLATLYPSRRAARLNPVDALRHG